MKKILFIIPIIFLFVLSSCAYESSINTAESQSSTLENSSITNSIEESNL